jgi:transcriptional antiterminator RfaH
MDAAWYTVQSKRYSERRVIDYLAARAIPTFFPFVEVVRRRNGTRRIGLEPMFPGYVFVQLEPFDRSRRCWDSVRWSPGVHRILGTEYEPVAVPENAISAIRDRTRELGFVRPGLRFGTGDRVRFRSGPLDGLEAILDRPASRSGRVHVLLALLGNTLRVEADELDLELA